MAIRGKLKEIKNKSAELESSVREKTVGYITAAFGLVAGLAWSDAVKALIETFFPGSGEGVFAKFGYALFITAAVVLITRALIRSTSAENKGETAPPKEKK